MDTKWKDTAKETTKNGIRIINIHRREIVGIVLLIAAVWGTILMFMDAMWYYLGEALFFGALVNLLLGGAVVLLRGHLLERCYDGWEPEGENAYEEWKAIGKTAEKRWSIAAGAALLLAVWYLLTTGYMTGFVLMFTVLMQYMLIRFLFSRSRRKKLDLLMECLEESGKRRVEEALAIERKSLEKVSRSDQLRVDLITNVSHDLKTPLTSMVGYIELIKKEELNDLARDYVDVISERAEKLKEMIDSLFNLAKASSGNVEIRPEKFEVNRLIEQIFADMDDRIKESGLEFVMQLAGEDTSLVTDNSYFYRICQNLIENALKYSAKGTRVFVKTFIKQPADHQPGLICLEITNTSGYPMDFTKEDIVERFARGDKARSGDGNGLGLAIVSTYAKALGGEFDIRIDCDQFKASLTFPVVSSSVL